MKPIEAPRENTHDKKVLTVRDLKILTVKMMS
jgi:hypothetical protein